MTYRLDSDFPRPYGRLIRKTATTNKAEIDAFISSAASRPNLMAWLVSNCHTKSRREDFAASLSQHLELDVFGGCGRACDDGRAEEDKCSDMMAREYRFYLALENAVCQDYITEKVRSFNLRQENV